MTIIKQTPALDILSVDFVAKQLIGSDCRPRREVWQCNICDTKYTHVDGGQNNMPFMKVPFSVKVGSKVHDVSVHICKNCGLQISEMFNE